MGELEKKLQTMILEQSKSVRAFAIENGIKVTTLYTIFERGVGNAYIGNIIALCNGLGIDADKLAEGQIVEKIQIDDLDLDEKELIRDYRKLSREDKDLILALVKKIK